AFAAWGWTRDCVLSVELLRGRLVRATALLDGVGCERVFEACHRVSIRASEPDHSQVVLVLQGVSPKPRTKHFACALIAADVLYVTKQRFNFVGDHLSTAFFARYAQCSLL